jgi:hypothetical protein
MTVRTTPERITKLAYNEVFVFGSNKAGRYGAGAARDAVRFGATYGHFFGRMGQCYAIPTKTVTLSVMNLDEIEQCVKVFIRHASEHPNDIFLVTPIGCGLATYRPEQIAPMFANCVQLNNVHLPASFWKVLVK